MSQNLPTFRRRSPQRTETPSSQTQSRSVKRVRELPGYEDHSARAAIEPATHLVNLVEDKNWYTPGMWLTAYIATAALFLGVGGAVVAVGGLWMGSLGIVPNLYMSIALPILIVLWIVGTLIFVNSPSWLYRIGILRTLRLVHRAGSGANAREKARVLGDSFLIIATVATFGMALAWYLVYRLFRGRRERSEASIYQRERDIRT